MLLILKNPLEPMVLL